MHINYEQPMARRPPGQHRGSRFEMPPISMPKVAIRSGACVAPVATN